MFQQSGGYVVDHPCSTDLIQQNQPEAAIDHFLVTLHELEELCCTHVIRSADWKPGLHQQLCQWRQLSLGQATVLHRKARGDGHACADGLAVQPVSIALGGLDSVPEGVSEIE